jgi:hypothetical protein
MTLLIRVRVDLDLPSLLFLACGRGCDRLRAGRFSDGSLAGRGRVDLSVRWVRG